MTQARATGRSAAEVIADPRDTASVNARLGRRPSIPRAEYPQRRERARRAAEEAGLDGLVVWSMGGSTLDRYSNVFWLTNHYDAGNVYPDVAPLFTGFGQAVLVVPVKGESILIVNQPDWRDDLVENDRVWVRRDLYGGAVEAIRAAGLEQANLGLTDEERMSATALRALEAGLPEAGFGRADDLLLNMRKIKSPAEIELMRYSSAVSAEMMNAMFSQVAIGKTDGDIAAAGLDIAARIGAVAYDLAMSSGPDNGHLWWSRMPSWDWRRPYEKGDIVHPDVYGAVDGYFFDFVRTIIVGGEPTPAQEEVLEAAIACIHAACAAAVPGAKCSDLWDISQAELVRRGVVDRAATSPEDGALTADDVESAGHGIGAGWEPPTLTPYDDTRLAAGMTLAVERYVTRAGVGTVRIEETVLVTDNGPEIMTAGCPVRWW